MKFNYVSISDLSQHVGEEVTLKGWVSVIRNQKNMQFIVLKDRTGKAQLTNVRSEHADIAEQIDKLTTESTLKAVGKVVENKDVKLGGIEVILSQLEVLSLAESPIPIDENTAWEKTMDWRFLVLRKPEDRLIFEVQTTIEHAMREYWTENGFIEIHSPKLLSAPSESGAELFSLEYFGSTAYLAQSPQFYKQMATSSAGFDRIFEIGPVFRANPSFTSRHDTEFTSVDAEVAWIESHHDIMAIEEEWLQHVFKRVAEKHAQEIKEYYNQDIVLPQTPFPKITMDEAREIVAKSGYEIPDDSKGDLDPEAERRVAAHVKEQYGHDFVFVTDYPTSVRPFYHMRHESDGQKTKSFDLLYRGLEVTTGAQREHRYEVLKAQALEKGLTLEKIQFYLDFFKYGASPHGGYGFGLTRLIMKMLGLDNVRQVTFLYRGPNRLTP